MCVPYDLLALGESLDQAASELSIYLSESCIGGGG